MFVTLNPCHNTWTALSNNTAMMITDISYIVLLSALHINKISFCKTMVVWKPQSRFDWFDYVVVMDTVQFCIKIIFFFPYWKNNYYGSVLHQMFPIFFQLPLEENIWKIYYDTVTLVITFHFEISQYLTALYYRKKIPLLMKKSWDYT